MKDPFSLKRIEAIDRKHVHGVYSRWPELARSGLGVDVSIPRRDYRKVYVLGMGGSAACGDLLAGWLWNSHGVEAQVCKGTIQASDLTGSLAIACSASGETNETIVMMKTALERNATVVSTSHGGALASESRKLRIPHIEMPEVVAPRYMLPFMVFSCLTVLDEALGLGSAKEAKRAADEMEKVGGNLDIGISADGNSAKRLALHLLDKSPSIYGGRTTRGAGIRFKNSLNENAKKHASYDEMPELFHNEIQAWEDGARGYVPIVLRDTSEDERERRLADAFVRLLTASGKGPIEVAGRGRSGLSRLMTLVYELEFATYYVAIGLGRDPFPTALISRIKRVV